MITKQTTTNLEVEKEYNDLFSLASELFNKYNADKQKEKIQIGNTYYYLNENIKNELNTILDVANAKNYPGLFEGEGTNRQVKINSLGEYFSVLGTLTSIHPRFGRIPLDEGLFVINTNTRTIQSPTGNFVYAVKGDHMAETIYFIVDRYYDGMDLATSTAVIQSESGNNNHLSGVTVYDVDSKPGYIIFGWPIDNVITEDAGTIRFAIRFYITSGSTLEYSLGTLPQTLTIQNTIFDNSIKSRKVENSKPYIKNYRMTGTPDITPPKFITGTTRGGKYDLSSSPVFQLRAESSTIGDTITYTWEYDSGEASSSSQTVSLLNYVSESGPSDQNTISGLDLSSDYIECYKKDESEDPSVPTWTKVEKNNELSTSDIYKYIDTREIKPDKAGIYYGSATVTVSTFTERTEHDPYYVNMPYILKFKRDEDNNLPAFLNYTYYTYSGNIEDFDINDYIPSSNTVYWEEDIENSQSEYPVMFNEDAFKSVAQDEVSLTLKNDNKDNTKKYCYIQNTANGITVESKESKTIQLVPVLQTLSIAITKNNDTYTITPGNENNTLLNQGLIKRTYEIKGRNADGSMSQLAVDIYDPTAATPKNSIKTQFVYVNSNISANPSSYSITITDELTSNVATPEGSETITVSKTFSA